MIKHLFLFAPVLAVTNIGFCAGLELAVSHPVPGAEQVPMSASIHLRFSASLDPNSLQGLTLHEADDGRDALIPIKRATDLTNASITLSSVEFLKPNTVYEVRGSDEVRSAASSHKLKPFRFRFKTGAVQFDPGKRLVFEPEVFDLTRSMTTVVFGPDRRIYAANAFGSLVRWDLNDGGKPVSRKVLLNDPRESRQYIDLEFDPESTADRLILWVSFSERLTSKKDPRHFFTGTIARLYLDGSGVRETRILVSGLPHGREKQGGFDTLPHQPNGLVFRDGKLYQSIGSTSSSGGPANWGISEQSLSACILEIDYQRISAPLDVHPDSGFDPSDPASPLRIFSTGVRNALEIVAHSNGRLYTAVNINDRAGRGDGVPNDPDIPGDQNSLVKNTTPNHESLFILERGRHYGFRKAVHLRIGWIDDPAQTIIEVA